MAIPQTKTVMTRSTTFADFAITRTQRSEPVLSSSSSSSSSNLYCFEDTGHVAYWDVDGWSPPPSPTTIDLPTDYDDHLTTTFFESELQHMPASDYIERFRDHSLDIISRQDAVNWILKVHSHYRFRPVTACLSVNYLDRFLSSHTLPKVKGWLFQLLSIACLSLAAKMEETHVPLPMDFQILEPRFVFQPRTIQRMELLVMANLKWRMRAVTPFDFVDNFARKLLNFDLDRLLECASDLILCTHRVIDFLDYRPSTIAAATILYAGREISDTFKQYDQNPKIFSELLSKEMVSRCQQLIEEHLVDTCPFARHKVDRAERNNKRQKMSDSQEVLTTETAIKTLR